jgi:hypothetical protein
VKIYLKAADKFGFELEGRKAKDFVQYRISRITIPGIEGRPKDLRLRIEMLIMLERDKGRKYNLKINLESKHTQKGARFRLLSEDKIKEAIL